MKIAFVTSSFYRGGITTYALEVIKALATDNEVYVIAGSVGDNTFETENVKVLNCESGDTSMANVRRLLQILNSVVRPDVIINSFSALMALAAPYVSNDVKIVTISHSKCFMEADIACANKRFVDYVIALSNFNAEYLRDKYDMPSEKLKVVYNFFGSTPDAGNILTAKLRRRPLRIVYAGGTAPAKNPGLVLRIINGLVDTDLEFEFIFLGGKQPPFHALQPFKSVEQLVKSDKRVTFTGKVNHETAKDIIASANIVLMPSRMEGCPMAMLEAMRTGCIVITSDDKTACREIVENEKIGIVVCGTNADDYARAIAQIVEHHDDYLEYYDRCHKAFLKNFSQDKWLRDMASIFSQSPMTHDLRRQSLTTFQYHMERCVLLAKLIVSRLQKIFMLQLPSAKALLLMYLKSHKNH